MRRICIWAALAVFALLFLQSCGAYHRHSTGDNVQLPVQQDQDPAEKI